MLRLPFQDPSGPPTLSLVGAFLALLRERDGIYAFGAPPSMGRYEQSVNGPSDPAKPEEPDGEDGPIEQAIERAQSGEVDV